MGAQNCFGAYWLRKRPEGGTHVRFTQHINSHPPLMLPQRFIFDFSWGKQVDYINSLRSKSSKQAQLGWEKDRTFLPHSFFGRLDGQGSNIIAENTTEQFELVGRLPAAVPPGSHIYSMLLLFAAVAAGVAMAILGQKLGARSWRRAVAYDLCTQHEHDSSCGGLAGVPAESGP